jgi:hypothetical protein
MEQVTAFKLEGRSPRWNRSGRRVKELVGTRASLVSCAVSLDVISAFVELSPRREPDTDRDPLDCAAPVRRRICRKLAMQSAECRADNRGRSSLWKAFRGR